MKKIAFPILLFVLAIIGAFSWKNLQPKVQEYQQAESSDAVNTKGKVRIVGDSWFGYFPLRSPEMVKAMRRAGYLLNWDDVVDYKERTKKLADGDFDFAVYTVDSYILNGKAENFPGIIVAVIDQSYGGDAIVALKSKYSTIDDLKGKSPIIAFTPASPSEFFNKSTSNDFGVPELYPTGKNRIETDGSPEALKALVSGAADVATLWEPDVSRALKDKRFVKLIGSEDIEGRIVDILVVNRKFAQENPQLVEVVLANYFMILNKYREDEALLIEHAKKDTGLPEKSIKSMLSGVKWVDFTENCEKWYGTISDAGYGSEALVASIESTRKILQSSGDFSSNPLPNGDPYMITNSTFLAAVKKKGIEGLAATIGAAVAIVNSLEIDFSPITDMEWEKQREVGTISIPFQSGGADLDMLAKVKIDAEVEKLKSYPKYRIKLKGHTGIRGDAEMNKQLSQDRVDAVAKYLEIVFGIDSDRMQVVGYGGTRPLQRKPNESKRAYSYRLPRVEIALCKKTY